MIVTTSKIPKEKEVVDEDRNPLFLIKKYFKERFINIKTKKNEHSRHRTK